MRIQDPTEIFLYKNTDTLKNLGLLILRVLFGFQLAFYHGWPTLSAFFSGQRNYPDPLGMGSEVSMGLMGFSEFFCAILVALGAYTRLATVPLIFGFGTAFFVFHFNDPFQNKELAFHYLIVYAFLFIFGAGKYSIDQLIKRAKEARTSQIKLPFKKTNNA